MPVDLLIATSTDSSSPAVGPLSYQQERCWKLSNVAGDIIPPLAFRLTGALDRDALVSALRMLTLRQSVLRTICLDDGPAPVQKVLREPAVDFEVLDVSHLDASRRDVETARLIRLEAARPFDLHHAPLLRARLVRLDEREHVLFFIVHHIIGDLWSMKILWRELAQLWRSAGNIAESGLEPLPLQYVDFAHRQRQWFSGAVLSKHAAYLKQWMEDVPEFTLPETEFRQDTTRRGEVVSLEITAELAQRLRASSRDFRVTPFMLLLAAFNIFLQRYTGADRFLLGAMIANRPTSDVEQLMGVFSTSLALRTDLSGPRTAAEVIAQTRDVFLDAYANQYLPPWQLAQLTGRQLESGRLRPRIAFTLQTAPSKPAEIPGLTATEFAASGATLFEGERGAVAAFDQAWEVWETGDALRLTVVYRTCFSRAAVAGMLEGYVDVLESIARRAGLSTGPRSTSRADGQQSGLE